MAEAKRKYENAQKAMKLAIHGDVMGMDELIEKDRSVINLQDEDHGNVPLHVASSKGNMALVRLLIGSGANVNIPDIFGNAAIHYACDKSQKDVLALLIQSKADIELADNRGNTPLHHACVADSMGCVNLLLKAGAVPDTLDHNLQTAASKAKTASLKAIIENTIKARKDGGESQGKESVNWMGFGIGLGVGIGLAMAQKQQAELETKLALIEAKRRADEGL